MGSTRLVHFFYDWSLPANIHGAIIIGINRSLAFSRQRSAFSFQSCSGKEFKVLWTVSDSAMNGNL